MFSNCRDRVRQRLREVEAGMVKVSALPLTIVVSLLSQIEAQPETCI